MQKKSAESLKFPLRGKYIAMLAPSFVVQFSYPSIISQLKQLGFDKVVELTFGAKMVNREYHKLLKKSKNLVIASPCPGIVSVVESKFPRYKKNLAPIDSPMIAMAKICKKTFPKHKVVFISPCHFKKQEAHNSKFVDYVIDYIELDNLFQKFKIGKFQKKVLFDKFYNDYTKIYPISGGLAKTAHLRGVIRENEVKTIDGINKVVEFLEKPDDKIKFLDVLFCNGGCIGGPCIKSNLTIKKRKDKVLKYLEEAKKEDIPEAKKGLLCNAKGIRFSR